MLAVAIFCSVLHWQMSDPILACAQGPEQVYDNQLLFNWQNVFWGANLKLAQLKVCPCTS